MQIAKSCLVLFFILSLSNGSYAARYWVATLASNWNNTANWSNTSGGAGGFSVPGIADDVNFDNLGIGSCTIDAAVSVRSITVNALYPGTISQGANAISTVNAGSFSGGIFLGGSANITIGGNFTLAGTVFTSTSAVLELDNLSAAFTSGTFLHNNGTVRLNAATGQTISGTSPVFYTLEFVGKGNTYTLSSAGNITVLNSLNTSGSLFYNLATGTIDVKGDITSSNTAAGCGGDALININGTGTQNFTGSTVAGAGALSQLTINKSSGTLNLANFPAVSNNFTYTAGTVNAGTSTFCFAHGNTGSYNITGSVSLGNIEFIVNTSLLTVTVAATLTATGDLTLAGGGNLVINTGNINVNGNLTLTNTGNGGGGSATINIVGTGSQAIDGTAVTLNQSRLPILNINKGSGTLSLLGNISFSANVTYTTGTIDPGTATCYIVNNLTITGSFSVYTLSISPAGNTTLTIASGSTITATNLLDLENGSNYITINTGTIAAQGDIIDNNSSLIGGGTGTILINGTGAQNLTTTGIIDQGRLPSVTINKPSGTLTLPSLLTVKGNWTYTAGILDVSTNNSTVVFENTLNITGSHTLNNVIFDGSNNYTFTTAAGTTLTVSGTMSMIGTGNITLNTGTINLSGNLVLTNTGGGGGTSVIAFVSGANQAIISSLSINQNCLPSITINKPGGTLSFPSLITVKGSWTYTAGTLDVTTNNSTVVFASPLGGGMFGITGSHSLNNVTFEGNNNNTATVSTGTLLTVTGTLSTIGASNVFINTPVPGGTAINAQGDILINNTSATGGGTGLILINGSGAQALTSTVAAGQGLMPYITVQKPAGTLTLTGILSESRDWTYVSGTVDASTNSSTVVFGGNNLTITSNGMNFYHATVTSNTGILGNTLSVNGNLTINGTGVLAAGANTINLMGNWADRGTVGFTEGTSTVNFNGASLQTVTSPGGENFTSLTINNTGAGIQLVNSATVATTLTMTQGNIDLNGNALTLGLSVANNGTLAYTAGSMIGAGSFTRWFKPVVLADGSTAGLFPMGTTTDSRAFYVAAPSVAPATGGTIAVAYANATSNTTTPTYMDGGSTIMVRKDLNWTLTTGNGLAGGTYDLEVQGTGFGAIGTISDLRVTLAGSVVGTPGTNAGTTANPQINRTGLTLANLSNTFYIGSINAVSSPLPITLISFTAAVAGGNVTLDWETAAEMNNDYFTVQRSKDGTGWENIQQIAGSGNSNIVSTYTAYDRDPYPGISYYRLVQTDLDGKQSYSPIRSINIQQEFSRITLFPNPATDHIVITFPVAGKYEISLMNGAGQLMNAPVSYTGNRLVLPVSNRNAGIYFIHIVNENFRETRKIVIKR
jgi:hypothetical protein